MDKSITITLIVVVGALILGGMIVMNFSPLSTTSKTVNVRGESSIDVTPDLVKVYLTVQTNGDTSKEAKDENAEIADDVIISLIREGFDRDEIQTQNFNIYPQYSYLNGVRKVEGYTATHSIVVEFDALDTDRIGDVIDSGVDAGADIGSINFELSQEKQNEYKAEAIKLAAEDAKIKAEALAEGLDKKLGGLVSVSDTSFGYSPWRIYDGVEMAGSLQVAEAKAAVTDIQPGEKRVSSSVQATYKLR